MLVLKTLAVEWYVDIKAYIQVWFEILMDSIFSYIACLALSLHMVLCPDPTHVRTRGFGYTSPNPWTCFRI